MKQPIEYKVVTLGESRVGKTSISLRYASNTFSEEQKSSKNANLLTKQLHIDGKKVKIHIWDTVGQEKFRSLAPNYYRDASGILIVYDITDRNSFNRAKEWIQELRLQANPNAVIIIVGNKCDLSSKREVDVNEAEAFARSVHYAHFLTSAKADRGVNELFQQLIKQMLIKEMNRRTEEFMNTRMTGRITISTLSHMTNQEAKKAKKCC